MRVIVGPPRLILLSWIQQPNLANAAGSTQSMLEHYAAILPKRMPQKQQIESFILTPQEPPGVANGNEPRLPLSSSHWPAVGRDRRRLGALGQPLRERVSSKRSGL